MSNSLKKLANLFKVSIERDTQYIEPRIVVISIVATICFPLYYVIWHHIFPQPYESLTLRLLGSCIFMPLIFVRHWPKCAAPYLYMYWYFATLYGLPFFFTFMLLMNAASTVWLMSALIAVFFMTLIHNLYNLIFHFSFGIAMAWLAYTMSSNHGALQIENWAFLTIYAFAIVGGGLLNFSAELINQARLQAMLSAASNIAHELRTPLLGIKSGAAGLRLFLPTLLDTYRMAQAQGLAVTPLRLAHLNAMQGVLDRIENEANHSNTIIDMLLKNTSMDHFSTEAFVECTILTCMEDALARYSFSSNSEQCLVKWEKKTGDFSFRGVELLMVHVLFNLLKNALFHIAKAGKGEIQIQVDQLPHGKRLIFRDTGTGIPPEILPHIFNRFYSWSADNNHGLGAGIGLAFCHSVMRAFGGDISCQSKLGEYTEFTLTFPVETTI